MSTPRLVFLYPSFARVPLAREARAAHHAITHARSPRGRPLPKPFRRAQSNFAQRYGPAAEPMPPPKPQNVQEPPMVEVEKPQKSTGDSKPPKKVKKPKQELLPALSASELQSTELLDHEPQEKPALGGAATLEPPLSTPRIDADTQPDRLHLPSMELLGEIEATNSDADFVTDLALPDQYRPLDRVLQLEAPLGAKAAEGRAPHLHTPPYVHHFDTYTLVNDLQKAGFSQAQSITIMKSVRSLLAVNMDLAQDGLVSRSDLENETYLFRAASSELRNEVQHTRHHTISRQRSDLAHLQHDSDILNQRVTQELQTLRDELKGLFDDRKMNVREEQRKADLSIQELHRKISVILMGDGKGNVESLRWFLTRRAAMAIGIAALLTLFAIRYTTYVSHQEEVAREKHAKAMKSAETQTDEGAGPDAFLAGAGVRSETAGVAGDSDEVLASASGKNGAGQHGVSYVSLG